MRAFVQRLLLVAVALAAGAIVLHAAWQAALDRYAGAWHHAPEDARWVLPAPARALVDAAFAGVESSTVIDARVAGFSRGQLEDDSFANDSFYRADSGAASAPLTWLHARMRLYAAGVRHTERADVEYVSRLLRQARAMPATYRIKLYARDAVYTAAGRRDDEATLDYVSNDYVSWLAHKAPEHIVPVVSVHPYREDAPQAIARWAEAGVTDISWLPVAQRIDFDDPRVARAYEAMAAAGMTLHLPVGWREADNGAQGWIAPAAARAAIDAGVNVQLSPAGARGPDGQRLMPALFALLRHSDDAGHVTIDLAGALRRDRARSVLAPLLQHPQFYAHLRYASGYPAMAMAGAVNLDALAHDGFLNASEVQPLRDIYDVNPLLFAFVALRRVSLPGTALRLPDRVFFAGVGP